eukprot:TRINITY_DN67506_c0_g1_i1.p1 TRINITY_DN67506_c0_g1~~TRINITY_DN67506_c0_g1_i1.p1  ORF type:complete len:251 (+),score=81.26 TRINITY_DN67506_c0_g1_i1:149-901(+)
MDYSFEIQQKLKANHQLQEIYAEIGSVPRDTLIAARHGFIDHLMGPQSLWEVFSSKERYRPHEKRVLTDMYDPFYVIQGTSRVVGTSWLSGLVVGGVQGFYEGLSKRQTRSWRTAYQSLLSFSRNKAPLRANQFAAVAFVCCFWEDIFRYMVLSNASHLQYGTHGWILGRFGSNKEEEKQAWQTDGRMCAVPGATVGVVTLRLLKGGAGAKAGVLMSNAILAAIGGFIYSHLWDKTDYFDIEKKFLEEIM